MSEKKLVIDQMKLNYEGLFDLNGLFRVIDEWFYGKGYDRWEAKNYEFVTPNGKDVDIELRPWKKTTEYFKNTIQIRFRATGVKDVEIKKEGAIIKINQGKLQMIFDGYLESDYENKWESKQIFFFFRTIVDKYIFRSHFDYYEKWLLNDFYEIHARIQRYLNLYRYEKQV